MNQPSPSRRRGRPKRTVQLEIINYASGTPSGPFLTLRYNPAKKCLCSEGYSASVIAPFCPHHGYYSANNEIKTPKKKTSTPLNSSRKRKRDGHDRAQEQESLSPSIRAREHQRHRTVPPQARDLERTLRPEMIALQNSNPNCTVSATVDLQHIFKPDQTMRHDSSPDAHIERAKHAQASVVTIDLFKAPLDGRKLVYRYLLVPSSKTITFPSPSSRLSFRQLNPELRTSILFTHPTVYNECRPILYGENTFVAADATDFFSPVGIKGLRPATARRIKHISIVRKGGARECDVTAMDLANSLHNMVVQSPAFLGLQSITIRMEVHRPVTMDLWELQMFLNKHISNVDVQYLYKKTDVVRTAAALVAFRAMRKGSPFQGMRVVEESDEIVAVVGNQRRKVNTNEICLTRKHDEHGKGRRESDELHQVVLDMLSSEVLKESPNADQRFKWFMEHGA